MAKSKSTRATRRKPTPAEVKKARKLLAGPRGPKRAQKFIEIEGHRLTPEMEAQLERAVDARRRGLESVGKPTDRADDLGFGDFLGEYRPTGKLKERLYELFDRMGTVNLAMMNLADYPFYSAGGTSRMGGCRLLRQLSGEYYRTAHLLKEIAAGMEEEENTKLQDWLEFAKRLELIEKNFEPAREAQS